MSTRTAVIVLKNQPGAAYQAIPDLHMRELAQGCRELGYAVEYVTLRQVEDAVRAMKIMRSGNCAFFLGHGYDMRGLYEGEQWAFEAHNVGCGVILESGWNNFPRLVEPFPGQTIFHLDPTYRRLYRSVVPKPAYHEIGATWGLTLDADTGNPNNPPPFNPADRDIDVLFVGSTRPAIAQTRKTQVSFQSVEVPEPLFRLATVVADIVAARVQDSMFDVCVQALRANKIDDINPYSHGFFQFVYVVDILSRQKRREKVLKLLAPFNVHVVSDARGSEPNFTYHDIMPWPEVEKLVDRARVVIHVATNQPEMIHERILNGMARGACVFTQTNAKIAETFAGGRELVCYGIEDDAELPGKLRTYLANPARLKEVADAGRDRARRDFNYREATQVYLQGLLRT